MQLTKMSHLPEKETDMNDMLALFLVVLLSLAAPMLSMAIIFRGFGGGSGKGGGVDD